MPKLAKFLADFMKAHLDAFEAAKRRLEIRTEGLEDVLSNDVLVSAEWKEVSSLELVWLIPYQRFGDVCCDQAI